MPDTTISSALFRSAFAGHTPERCPNNQGQVGLRVSATRLRSVTLLSTWISGHAAWAAAVQSALGALPERSGQTAQTPQGLLMRTGPDEAMLIADDETERVSALRQHITAEVGAVADLSHARCCIRMQGSACRTVLGKLFALDLRESAFPVGEVRMSGTHHVPSLLHRRGPDAFDWVVFTTYAHDQLSTLLDAAQEYGYELESVA